MEGDLTILPAQIRSLLVISEWTDREGALGLKQDGSILRIDTGTQLYWIDAGGKPMEVRDKE